ncbi:MAG: WXG100 family type VII secretion target [Mycobacterium sp.]|uniref:WXG100 family type VII secretion target n=1 Tax=Mycobacterium sp. TaxID=1785 RepID=UPI003F9A887E
MAAGGEFRVDPEALAGSAEHVSGQGEDLASAHLSSDNRIEGAQSGWVGASAAALNARMAAWLETSRRLVARVGGHALDLQNDHIKFTAAERDNADRLRAVGFSAEGADGADGVAGAGRE